jgi:hypothetical protein
MTSRQAKIQEDTHFRIMRILQENPDLTQRELADHRPWGWYDSTSSTSIF